MTLQQQKDIGIWCNGNTTDSGPVIPGSNPGIPTKSIFLLERCFFVLGSFVDEPFPGSPDISRGKFFDSTEKFIPLCHE